MQEYLGSEIFYDYGTDNIWSGGNTNSDTWDENGSEWNGEWDCPSYPDVCEEFIDSNGDGTKEIIIKHGPTTKLFFYKKKKGWQRF